MAKIRMVSLCVAAGLLAGPAWAQDYSWKPDRPINIIVPWSAGGSTDQVTRVVARRVRLHRHRRGPEGPA